MGWCGVVWYVKSFSCQTQSQLSFRLGWVVMSLILVLITIHLIGFDTVENNIVTHQGFQITF